MNFEEFKKLKNQANSPNFSLNETKDSFLINQSFNQSEILNLPDNLQLSSDKILSQYSSDFVYNRKSNWWLWALLIIFFLAVSIFFISIFIEIQKRQKIINEIVDRAKQMTESGKLENNTLVQELIKKTTTSSSESVATSTITTSTIIIKDKNRELAERYGSSFWGNQTSTLVIVEFADFDCPVCLEEFPIIRSIISKYQNELLFIFRNYPVRGNDSIMLAQAALCAEEQGKFWQFHDRLFSNQGKIKTTEDVKNLAIMSGLDWDKLNQCVISDKYRQRLAQDTQDALDLGVRGTPTFFINGNKLEGAISATDWEAIIKKYKELINNI